MFAAMDDIAREFSEAERQPATEIKKSAKKDEKGTQEKKSAAKFAKRVHTWILQNASTIRLEGPQLTNYVILSID